MNDVLLETMKAIEEMPRYDVVNPYPSCEALVFAPNHSYPEPGVYEYRTHRACRRTGHYKHEDKRYCLQHYRIIQTPDPLA